MLQLPSPFMTRWTRRPPAAACLERLDALPVAMAVFDGRQCLLTHGTTFAEALGLGPQDLAIGMRFADLVACWRGPASTGEPARGLLLIDGARPTRLRRVDRTLPDGRRVEVTVHPLPDDGLLLAVADVSAQRQREARLREHEQLLTGLDAGAGLQASAWDARHRCSFGNPAFLAALGRPAEAAFGRHAADLLPAPVWERRRPFAEAAAAGRPQAFDEDLREADGSTRSWRVTLVPAGTGYVVRSEDVTALRTAQAEAQRQQRAQRLFLSNLGHELRTPMNAIVGLLQVLEAGHGTLPGGIDAPALAPLRQAARSLLDVVTGVLDFADASGGAVTLSPRGFAVDDLLRDLAAVLVDAVGDRDLAVVFDVGPGVPDRLVADDRRLRQVLLQLAANAIKFTPAGQVVLRLTRDAASPPDERIGLVWSVEDSGVGLAPEQIARLQQDIGQLDASATRSAEGTGLGLATCRALLRLMDSELEIRSAPGAGSRFAFRMTAALEDDHRPAAAGPGAGRPLLIAHAREPVRDALAGQARALGWRPLPAASLEEARAIVADATHLAGALVDWRLGDGAPFSAATALAPALARWGVAPVAFGPGAGRQAWLALPPDRRAPLREYLPLPASAGLLAASLSQAQVHPLERGAARAPAARPLAGLRVLLAEDNPNNQFVATELLKGQGAEVTVAIDGLDTLTHLVASGRFDAVLMDWQMPHMDGLEATREIRQIAGLQQLPIIALTANASEADRQACLAAGMDAHLAKPVDVRELVAALLAHTRPARPPAAADPGLQDLERVLAQALAVPATATGSAPAMADEPDAVTGLDREAALASLGGDDTLYGVLAQLFLDDAPRMLGRLREALADGRRSQAANEAHTLKGTAGTMGARALAQAAGALECALAGPASAGEAALLKRLEAELQAALGTLSQPML